MLIPFRVLSTVLFNGSQLLPLKCTIVPLEPTAQTSLVETTDSA